MTENKEEIVQAAENLFLAYGIRSVTMDDISRKLAISKKTIYQHYRDKDEIVCSATQRFLERERSAIATIKEQSQNAIHELALLSAYIKDHLQNVNPSILFDLQKYHRQAWNIYLKFKEQVFLFALEETLQQGIEQGLFRQDIHPHMLAVLRLEELQWLFDNEVFPREVFNQQELFSQLSEHFIRGILSRKGTELSENYIPLPT